MKFIDRLIDDGDYIALIYLNLLAYACSFIPGILLNYYILRRSHRRGKGYPIGVVALWIFLLATIPPTFGSVSLITYGGVSRALVNAGERAVVARAHRMVAEGVEKKAKEREADLFDSKYSPVLLQENHRITRTELEPGVRFFTVYIKNTDPQFAVDLYRHLLAKNEGVRIVVLFSTREDAYLYLDRHGKPGPNATREHVESLIYIGTIQGDTNVLYFRDIPLTYTSADGRVAIDLAAVTRVREAL